MAYIIPVTSAPRMSMNFEVLAPIVKRDIMNSFAAKRRFSYDQNNGLVVAIPFGDRLIRIPRATPAQLKAHVSTDIRLTRAGNCSSVQPEPAPEQPYTWWLAQLIHYGLHLQLSKDEAKLEIELAMRAGVLTVPEYLHDLEKDGRKAMKHGVRNERVPAINTQLSQMSSKKCTSRRILSHLSSYSYPNDEQEELVPQQTLPKPAEPEVKMQNNPASSGGRSESGTDSSRDLDATFEVDAAYTNSKLEPPKGAKTAQKPSLEEYSEDESDSDGFHATELSFVQPNHSASGKKSKVQSPIGSTTKQKVLTTTFESNSEDITNTDRRSKVSTLSKASTQIRFSMQPKTFPQLDTPVLPLLVNNEEESRKFEFNLKRHSKSIPQKLESLSDGSMTDTSYENPDGIYEIRNSEKFSRPSQSCSFAEIVAIHRNKSATNNTVAPDRVDGFRPRSSPCELYGVRKSIRERPITQKNIGNTSPTVATLPAGDGYDTSAVEIPEKLRGDMIRLKLVMPHLSTRSCLRVLKSNKSDFAAACKALIAEIDGVQNIESTKSSPSHIRKILVGGSSAPRETELATSTMDTTFLPRKSTSSSGFQDKLLFTDTARLDFRGKTRKLRDRFANLPVRECNEDCLAEIGHLEANAEHLAPEKVRSQMLWDGMLLEDVEDAKVRSSVEFMQTVLPGRGVEECYESLELTNHDFERALDCLGKSKPRIPVKLTYSSDENFANASKITPNSKKTTSLGGERDVSWVDSEDFGSKRQKTSKQLSLTETNTRAAQSASCGIQRNSKPVLGDHMKSADFEHTPPKFEWRMKRKSKIKPAEMLVKVRNDPVSIEESDRASAAQTFPTLELRKDCDISRPELHTSGKSHTTASRCLAINNPILHHRLHSERDCARMVKDDEGQSQQKQQIAGPSPQINMTQTPTKRKMSAMVAADLRS